jgi:hypothetical protein
LRTETYCPNSASTITTSTTNTIQPLLISLS